MSAQHNAWYVQIEGQVYGPYTHALMGDYVGEGRILPESQIAADPAQGFVSAQRFPQYAEWNAVQSQPQKIAVGSDIVQPVVQSATHPQVRAKPVPDIHPHAAPVQSPTQELTPIHTKAQTQVQPHVQQQVQAQPTRHPAVLLVMAEIRSGHSMGFLQALQGFGPAQRIGDTVWLVRTASNVQTVRNALSQSLTRQDRIFVMDSFANETAWFNIGADMDTSIRKLWSGQV